MICSRHSQSHSHSHSHSHNKTLLLTTTTTTAMSSLLALALALALTAPVAAAAAAAPLKAGDTICTEGYIMDTFCIDRGTLLDNPTVVTLEQPEEHSIHCLVDVNSCVSSPFEVLLDPTTTTGDNSNNNNNNKNLYSRGWRLDEESQKQAIALARTVGTCSTCTTSTDVAVPHAKGFRAAIKAVILNLNEDDPSIPPTIQALGMEDTTAYNKRKSKSNDVGVDFDFDVENVGVAGVSACQNFFQMEDIADVVVVAVDDDAPCPTTTTTSAAAAALKAGDEICTEGFVMDQFCIDRGTLFDNPSVKTLEGPEKHSVHCLIDVESCVSSNFEILLDPPPSDPTTSSSSSTAGGGGGGSYYTRGWRLDADSKQRAVELAKSVGTCTDCMEGNTEENSHVRGFRVVTRAVVLDLNTDDDSVPPTIQVLDMEDTTAYSAGSSNNSSSSSSACQTFFGMNDIVDQHRSSSSSCGAAANNGSGSLLAGIAVDGGGSQNALRTKHFAHASLMLIGWGFLLPTGALTAKFFKHRPNGLWFRYHRILQTLGLAVALVGWIIALLNFNVFMDYGFRNFQHGVCGMVVMILGLLQPLNAFFRPHHHHPPLLSPGDNSNNNSNSDNNSKSKARVIWEIVHKTSGWLAVALAVPTIVLGTKSLPVPDDQTKFQIGYGVGCIGGLLLLLAYMFYDKTNYATTTNTDANADGEESPDKEC